MSDSLNPKAPKSRSHHDALRMAELAEAIRYAANMGYLTTEAESIQEWIDELWDITYRYLPEKTEMLINGVPVVPYGDVP